MPEIKISTGYSGRLTVSFQYRPYLVTKIKSIEGHRWHPGEKYWSFPYTGMVLKKILEIFMNEDIQMDPAIIADHLEDFSNSFNPKS